MAKKRIPKEKYDQLYYYVPGRTAEHWIVEKGESPLNYTSPRRYDSLDAVRKAALARSRKVYRDDKERVKWGFPPEGFVMWIFKGTEFVGTVQYDFLKCFAGLWSERYMPKDYVAIDKDGCVI